MKKLLIITAICKNAFEIYSFNKNISTKAKRPKISNSIVKILPETNLINSLKYSFEFTHLLLKTKILFVKKANKIEIAIPVKLDKLSPKFKNL